MGKRKNRHCNSKREVIQREIAKRRQEKKRVPTKLEIYSKNRAAIIAAKEKMRDANRRESKNDMD
jgi:hypothetical protein